MTTNIRNSFLGLVRVGLFPVHNKAFVTKCTFPENVDWEKMYQLAKEQSVQGVVLQGIDWLKNYNLSDNADDGSTNSPQIKLNIPQILLLQWIGELQMIEQRNLEMNKFVAQLMEKLRKEDIFALLVKGQGIAQCYGNPLWRTSGDVDLLLSDDDYKRAKDVLIPVASKVDDEDVATKHQALEIKGFEVELHGKMPFEISKRVDDGIDEVLNDIFLKGHVRSWDNNGKQVLLPSPDNDVILVFTHFLHHFFIEGVGLRQICDWCRLLYTYRDSLNYGLLESRINRMGLMSEWKAFYNLASRYLGMPNLGSGLMACDSRYDKKADRIMEFILEVGNFGHNKDLSYRVKYKGLTYKIVSLWRRLRDFSLFATIFPIDAPRFFVTYVTGKVK